MINLTSLTEELFLRQPYPRSYTLENGKTKPTKRYRKFRYRILQRDQFTCQICGEQHKNNELEIHHVLPRRSHKHLCYVPSNVITLCKECHREHHMKEGY